MKPARKRNTNILGKEPNAALKTLISLSKRLSAFADHEMQALAMGDMMRFAYTQQDKEKLASDYAAASQEFRQRVEEFRGADRSLLNQLDKLQVELKQKAESNNTLISQVRDRAFGNTKTTLFTVQEMGQRATVPVKAAYVQAESSR